jgi:hypothetical protein
MTQALAAAFKSSVMAEIDRHHLSHDEAVQTMLDLCVYHAPRAGIDRRALLALLDDKMAAAEVERRRGDR